MTPKSTAKRRSKRNAPEHNSDFDGAWKEALPLYFKVFMMMYFPDIAGLIDWSEPPKWLDKEISQVIGRVKSKNRAVDLLVQVRLLSGDSQRILIHIEFQSSWQKDFEERLTDYNCGLRFTLKQHVVTLAILGDLDPNWLPTENLFQFGGFLAHHRFPVCKLVTRLESDWKEDWSLPVVLARAQIEALRTADNPPARAKAKWKLVRRLYDLKLSKDEIRELFRLIDWMMHLRMDLEVAFTKKLAILEKELEMPYVTSVERLAQARGEAIGQSKLMVRILKQQCGRLPSRVRKQVEQLSESAAYNLCDVLRQMRTLSDLEDWLSQHVRG